MAKNTALPDLKTKLAQQVCEAVAGDAVYGLTSARIRLIWLCNSAPRNAQRLEGYCVRDQLGGLWICSKITGAQRRGQMYILMERV